MELIFGNSKECCVFRDLVQNPDDRSTIKKFTKYFNSDIIKPCIKIHQKLKNAENAQIYNQVSSKDNKIELYQGVKDNENTILKVKLSGSYRKFFYFYDDFEKDIFSVKKNWKGQFASITHIFIYEINKHNYKNI